MIFVVSEANVVVYYLFVNVLESDKAGISKA